MFESLSEKLSGILDKLTGRGALSEDDVNAAMREVLLRYSPFHNIKPGTTYPSFFITVSTEDNRVGPGHARKLAARLEQVGAKAYYFEDSEGGHGVSDALQRPELMALRMTFLIDRLMN